VIEFGNKCMLQPVHQHLRHHDRQHWLPGRGIWSDLTGVSRLRMTYVRYCPEYIVARPSETFWKEKSLREVEHRSAQFDQIAKCHKTQHESEREALHDVYTRHAIIPKMWCNKEGIPAQVIWNKLSFSNFLNTLPLLSTN